MGVGSSSLASKDKAPQPRAEVKPSNVALAPLKDVQNKPPISSSVPQATTEIKDVIPSASSTLFGLSVKTGDSTLKIHIEPDHSILAIKQLIEVQHGIPVAAQKLIGAGQILENHLTARDYNLQRETNINLVAKKSSVQNPASVPNSAFASTSTSTTTSTTSPSVVTPVGPSIINN